MTLTGSIGTRAIVISFVGLIVASAVVAVVVLTSGTTSSGHASQSLTSSSGTSDSGHGSEDMPGMAPDPAHGSEDMPATGAGQTTASKWLLIGLSRLSWAPSVGGHRL